MNREEELKMALQATLEWIDAVPSDVIASLPSMPGFDRDWVDGILSVGAFQDSDRRVRKPQPTDRYPPGMSSEEIEKAIDNACGCKGRHNCDCVSVFNKTRSDLWYSHNTKDDAA